MIGTWAGPYEPGTAYVMAHHSIGDVGDGHLGNWGFQEGGMGAVADAIAAAARAAGAEIRTGAKVSQVLLKDGRAAGVDTRKQASSSRPRSWSPPCTRAPRSWTTLAASTSQTIL